MALTFDPVHLELVSVAKGSGENAPTYITTRRYDPAEWKQHACHIVPRNLDFQLIDTYTLGKTQACPDLPVDGSVVRNWLKIAQSRLNQQDTAGASAAYQEATRLAIANHNDDAELANLVCLHGTISRYAHDILPACDHAVALSPDSGPFRNSRALARTLAGDRTGAIKDLQFFIDWADNSGLFQPNTARMDVGVLNSHTVAQRQAWIAELKNNGNPFTPQVINSVWTEYLQDQGGNTDQTCPVNVGTWVAWVQRSTGC